MAFFGVVVTVRALDELDIDFLELIATSIPVLGLGEARVSSFLSSISVTLAIVSFSTLTAGMFMLLASEGVCWCWEEA